MAPTLETAHTVVDCQYCGEPIDLTAGEHTYRQHDGRLICESCNCPPECDRCGKATAVVLVTERDDAVGYVGTLLLCVACREKSNNGR